jgi:hypothetical protein
MPFIIILVISAFVGLGGMVGYNISTEYHMDETSRIQNTLEKVTSEYKTYRDLTATSTDVSMTATVEVNNADLEDAVKSLRSCWYEFDRLEKQLEEDECSVCEDCQPLRVEIDNILKSREECRINESNLAEQLKTCEAKYPF